MVAMHDTESGSRTTKISWRGIFLSGFGVVYICAFTSYWLQFPGILGANGLLPASQYWERVRAGHTMSDSSIMSPWGGVAVAGGEGTARLLRSFAKTPCLLWFGDSLLPGLDVDNILEGLALLGTLSAMLAVVGVHHVTIFATCYLCYLSLYLTGQTWLSFQWDIFLLETGASCILYSRWWGIGPATRPQPAVAWLLRAQWVKFM